MLSCDDAAILLNSEKIDIKSTSSIVHCGKERYGLRPLYLSWYERGCVIAFTLDAQFLRHPNTTAHHLCVWEAKKIYLGLSDAEGRPPSM